MKLFKKSVAYALSFVTVLSSFTILPSGFSNMADVSAVELTTQKSNAVESNKNEIPVAESKAVKTYTEGDFEYVISFFNNNEVEVAGYIGTSTDIVIPDVTTGSECPQIANKKVTVIRDEAFYQDKITSVTFGKNITKIGEYAFYECDKLESLTISDGIKTIESNAFYSCENIKEIEIGNSVTTIEEYAFAHNTALKTVTVGSGCTYIDGNAFYGDKSLENIIVSPDNQTYASDNGVLMDKDKIIIWTYPSARGGVYKTPENVTAIGEYAFSSCENITEVIISDNVTLIGQGAFLNCANLKKLVIGDNVLVIRERAFELCQNLTEVSFGKELLCIDNRAFYQNFKLSEVDLSKCTKLTEIGDNAFYNNSKLTTLKLPDNIKKIDEDYFSEAIPNYTTIYCGKNSTTHNTLTKKGYTKIKFLTSDVHLVDIKVNGVSINGVSTGTKNYTAYVDNTKDVVVEPVFEEADVNYTVTAENNVHTINVFDENNEISNIYNVAVKEHNYTVVGDVNLTLSDISSTKVGGSIALQAGTYKLNIAKGSKQFGYNKTFTDYCNGLTLSEKYSSNITLNATGGTYTFQFDTTTNKLVVKHNANLPNEYLIGNIDTILKPVENKPLSIGIQQLPAGTYTFKLSIGGTEYGYNKVINDSITSSMTVSDKYSAQITLNATGGIYTFILNTETNGLMIRHTPTNNETTADVHISGTFNLVLNDKSATGEDLTTASGTTYLEEGCYTFKVYNYGVAYTAGAVINNNGKRTLSSQYTTPVTLNANGGTYKFVFNKETGVLTVSAV